MTSDLTVLVGGESTARPCGHHLRPRQESFLQIQSLAGRQRIPPGKLLINKSSSLVGLHAVLADVETLGLFMLACTQHSHSPENSEQYKHCSKAPDGV
jgi:hypothetical protein